MRSGVTFYGAIAINDLRIFQPTQALHPDPSMHSPEKITRNELETWETLLQQTYHVYIWKSTLEATCSICTQTLQEWPILCPVWKYWWWLPLPLSSPKFIGEVRGLFHIDNVFFLHLSHLFFSLSPAWNRVHLMLRLQESAQIHKCPSSTSIPVPSTTLTQSMTFHHLIWHGKFNTNCLSWHNLHHHLQSSKTYLRRKSSRGTHKPCWPECIFPMLDDVKLGMWSNCFSINDSVGFWCQISSKLHPMKQKMQGSCQFL